MKFKIALLFFIPFSLFASELATSISGNYVEGPQIKARTTGIDILLKKEMTHSDNWGSTIGVGILVETGSIESTLTNEYSPQRYPYLHEGSLNYSPISWLKVDVGGLSQSYHQAPIFLTDSPFFGARETLSMSSDHLFFDFQFSQLSPSNQKLSQRLGNIDEGSATLFTHSVHLGLQNSKGKIQLGATLFEYDQLNSDVAFNSQRLGNTISGTGSANSSFLYGFKGYLFQVKLNYLGYGLNANLIHNNEAPVNYSNGKNVELYFNLDKNFISLEWFQIESDAVPAYYNGRTYNTGREGYGIRFIRQINAQDELSLRAYQTDTLNFSPYHNERTIIQLGITRKIDVKAF